MLSNVLNDVLNIDADDNEAENTDGDLVEEPIGELAHDERTGGKAEGGHDGEGQHDGHDRVEEVIEEGSCLHVRPEENKRWKENIVGYQGSVGGYLLESWPRNG